MEKSGRREQSPSKPSPASRQRTQVIDQQPSAQRSAPNPKEATLVATRATPENERAAILRSVMTALYPHATDVDLDLAIKCLAPHNSARAVVQSWLDRWDPTVSDVERKAAVSIVAAVEAAIFRSMKVPVQEPKGLTDEERVELVRAQRGDEEAERAREVYAYSHRLRREWDLKQQQENRERWERLCEIAPKLLGLGSFEEQCVNALGALRSALAILAIARYCTEDATILVLPEKARERNGNPLTPEEAREQNDKPRSKGEKLDENSPKTGGLHQTHGLLHGDYKVASLKTDVLEELRPRLEAADVNFSDSKKLTDDDIWQALQAWKFPKTFITNVDGILRVNRRGRGKKSYAALLAELAFKCGAWDFSSVEDGAKKISKASAAWRKELDDKAIAEHAEEESPRNL